MTRHEKPRAFGECDGVRSNGTLGKQNHHTIIQFPIGKRHLAVCRQILADAKPRGNYRTPLTTDTKHKPIELEVADVCTTPK